MRIVENVIKWFVYISTGILIVCAINFEIADVDSIPRETLWQILLSGFLTTVVTLLLFPKEDNKKYMVFIKCLIHYAVLCIVMLICGNLFGWMDLNFAGIMMMLVSVACVYLLAFLAYYLIDCKRAEEINQKLKERYGDNE